MDNDYKINNFFFYFFSVLYLKSYLFGICKVQKDKHISKMPDFRLK